MATVFHTMAVGMMTPSPRTCSTYSTVLEAVLIFRDADCGAVPALFYGNMVEPFGGSHQNVTAYFERLKARRAVARVLQEAEPYFKMVPK